MIHSYGSTQPGVKEIQQALNGASKTRLPRLSTDNTYGSLTMARVMEFQSQEKLKVVDGIYGPKTEAALAKRKGNTMKPAGFCILVDLINGRLRAFQQGAVALDFKPIRGGSATDPSTRGVFRVTRALRHHTSSQFPEPPGNMDFALFYHKGEALHQGPPTESSHGCIHVEPSQAELLFNWAGGEKNAVDKKIMVIVLKRTA